MLMNNEPTKAGDLIGEIFDKILEDAPDPSPIQQDQSIKAPTGHHFSVHTKIPARYRSHWTRPDDDAWAVRSKEGARRIENNALLALIGPRGTGKTRLAVELARDTAKDRTTYLTAMDLFLRIRASYKKTATEDESQIIKELSSVRLLILDELQERGDTSWEDRVLTHLIDKRYGAELPTVVIANLTSGELADHLGNSITDRLTEGGGVIEVTGTSHRADKTA